MLGRGKRKEGGRDDHMGERERREFKRERGWLEEGEGEMGREGNEEMEKEDCRKQEEERREKIKDSRYNRWYREIRTEGIPKYLEAGWGEERYGRIARYRLGNEMKGGWYWEKQEERRCRMCGGEEETWEHVLERCAREEESERGIGEKIREILDEGGEGEEWMKRMERKRKKGVESG